MLAALGSADPVTWLSIAVKALAYASTLGAIGSVLVPVLLSEVSARGRVALRLTAALTALAAAIFTVLRFPIQASFLMGSTWEGATDPMILRVVAESPLGTSASLRLVGLALILCVLWNSRYGQYLALPGALLASISFALRGHALGPSHLFLGALVTLHIVCLAFWVGALAPLARAARFETPESAGALAHAFGALALWAVGLSILAGGLTLALLGAATPAALSSPYGQMFVIKLALFAGALALAGVNRLALAPALLAAKVGAGARLRRSIGLEAVLMGGILVTTAALTTVSSPPDLAKTNRGSIEFRPDGQAHLKDRNAANQI